eukprot:COSAG02_NODE_2934_length_7705_cov_11.991191_5_plen_68_part_00
MTDAVSWRAPAINAATAPYYHAVVVLPRAATAACHGPPKSIPRYGHTDAEQARRAVCWSSIHVATAR